MTFGIGARYLLAVRTAAHAGTERIDKESHFTK
jgi:hypothetical protein